MLWSGECVGNAIVIITSVPGACGEAATAYDVGPKAPPPPTAPPMSTSAGLGPAAAACDATGCEDRRLASGCASPAVIWMTTSATTTSARDVGNEPAPPNPYPQAHARQHGKQLSTGAGKLLPAAD